MVATLTHRSAQKLPNDWILVTGFGPFPGVEVNPTQLLAERLSGELFHGMPVVSCVLDVSFERAPIQLLEALSSGWPRFIVHFGVAAASEQIRVESQGVNCKSAKIPDVDGQQFSSSVVSASYPLNGIWRTSIPTAQLALSLNDHGYPAVSSDDAGRYVCNATYFHSLSHVAESGINRPSVFIHMPALSADAEPEDQSLTAWTPERLYESAAHIIDWIASNALEPGSSIKSATSSQST